MPIFQTSVLKDYPQDEAQVATRWAEFQSYLNKIDFIKTSKEENYQVGFLQDFFEKCLGYTLDTTNHQNFNLQREKKNETDSKKADAVIYENNEVIGVIELKGYDTRNLNNVEDQAFNYHNSHKNSKYIIISNFDELRFYIDKKTAYESFSLFNLNYDEFKKLHLILSYESIKSGIPLQIKEKSSNHETQISKELYKDFSNFRTALFENIILKNPNLDKTISLRLTQKLCDRIIFILFAEDRGLLHPNTINEIIEEFQNQKRTNDSLYEIFKFYFEAINIGNEKLNIPKYNGGLFSEDTLLNNLIINDDILKEYTKKLSIYDFASEVSVNILGHIFEQSLSDIEELQSNINNLEFDKSQTKRKKDGIFYTPSYITKYIVDNTLGKICTQKRDELKLNKIYTPKNPKKLNKTEQEVKQNLLNYKDWLLNLKIIDPACGSGAFLNQALEFLINEHKQLQNDLALMGDLFASYTLEESILENNLYGVDINEDAIEIARLSLWLRTARKGRTLTNLNDKIICANSLLDMPFEENSFDVVIGNPPYVRQERFSPIKPQLQEKYDTYTGTADLFVYFYELGIKLLKPNGLKGYICSNKFFRAKYGENLREYILKNCKIEQIIDFNGVKVFEDASVDSTITILKKGEPQKNSTFLNVNTNLIDYSTMNQSDLTKTSFIFISNDELNIKKKIEAVGTPLKEWDISISYGIRTGFNKAFIIDENTKNALISEDSKSAEIIKPLLRGRDIKKYEASFANLWVILAEVGSSKWIEKDYPVVYNHLKQYEEELKKRGQVNTKNGHHWIELDNSPTSKYLKKFEKEKIIWQEMVKEGTFLYDKNSLYTNDTCRILTGSSLQFLLSYLNSKLCDYVFKKFFAGGGLGNSVRYKSEFMSQLPIPKISKEQQQPFIELVEQIIDSKEKIKKYKKHFEILNAVDKIEITEEIEKLEIEIKNSIKTIDTMVYKLYGLTADEIKIVEGL